LDGALVGAGSLKPDECSYEILVWKRKDKQAIFALYGVSRFF
jgi:hypothetical protein